MVSVDPASQLSYFIGSLEWIAFHPEARRQGSTRLPFELLTLDGSYKRSTAEYISARVKILSPSNFKLLACVKFPSRSRFPQEKALLKHTGPPPSKVMSDVFSQLCQRRPGNSAQIC